MKGQKAPWHLWVVGVIGLLWNGFGVYDYLMSHIQGDVYLRAAGMPESQIAYFHSMPAWMTAAWAIGVWGALAGTLLLLLRSRHAWWTFLISLVALVVTLVYEYGVSDGAQINGTMAMVTSAVILVGCILFTWYAWNMTRRGVLD
jgi:hypothetical protein